LTADPDCISDAVSSGSDDLFRSPEKRLQFNGVGRVLVQHDAPSAHQALVSVSEPHRFLADEGGMRGEEGEAQFTGRRAGQESG
jgi:hypothetical protein